MKFISEIAEEESRRIFWVIQTIFGYLIGRSFHTYAPIFIPPFKDDIITLSLALISVYICILWSWIDFSFTLIVAPYSFKNNFLEKLRFVTDLVIVLLYSFLLVDLDQIKNTPNNLIAEFFIVFALIYFFYIVSGVLRILQYGKRASRIVLLISFCFIFGLCAVAYLITYKNSTFDHLHVNRIFFSLTILLTIAYRVIRSRLSNRKFTIAIDVDGVLANQIDGILPVILKKYQVDIKYDDVIQWNFPVADTGIDKIIVEELNQRSYVLNMPLHKNANIVIDSLIKKYYIAIATARSTVSDHWTKEWLNKNKVQYDSYHNLKEGNKQNANEDFDILIDDYIGNIKAFLKKDKSKGKAILFSQPWNQNREELQEYLNNGSLQIVASWDEVLDKIEILLSQEN